MNLSQTHIIIILNSTFSLFIAITFLSVSSDLNNIRCYAFTAPSVARGKALKIRDALKSDLYSSKNSNFPIDQKSKENDRLKTVQQIGKDDANKRSRQTSIEQANQNYKQKRLKDRMEKLYLKVQSTTSETRIEEIQKRCDELLGICAASNEWTKYEEVIEIMYQRKLSIQPSTFRSCLRECYASGNGESSMRIFDKMQSEKIRLECGDLDLVIGSLCRQNSSNESWQKAVDLIKFAAENYDRIEGDGIKIESYNHVFACMEKSGKHYKDALSLLSLMKQENMTSDPKFVGNHPSPNIATYHAILKVLVASNQVGEASKLLQSLSQQIKNEQGTIVKPLLYTFEIVLSALTRSDQRGKNYKEAVKLLDLMISLDIIVPIEIFNRVISSCAKARKANTAMDVFSKMKAKRQVPDTVTYNSLISACANEGMTDKALKLFNECKDGGNCKPDVITYTNTIRACGQSRMVKKALKLLSDAKKESIQLDVFLYTALIDGMFNKDCLIYFILLIFIFDLMICIACNIII